MPLFEEGARRRQEFTIYIVLTQNYGIFNKCRPSSALSITGKELIKNSLSPNFNYWKFLSREDIIETGSNHNFTGYENKQIPPV